MSIVRTNLCPVPNAEEVAGVGLGWANVVVSKVTTPVYTGSTAFKFVCTGGPFPRLYWPVSNITPGENYTFSFYLQSSVADQWHGFITFRDSGGTALLNVPGTPYTATPNWQRIVVTGTAPAGATSASVHARGYQTPVNGTVAYVGGAMMEKASSDLPYFDGDSPSDNPRYHWWSGAPGISVSYEGSPISATSDPLNARVDVSVDRLFPDGPVTVYRVHEDGSAHPIYIPDVSGGVTQTYDYDAPFGEVFHYEAWNGTDTVKSYDLSVVLSGGTWLSVPGLPAYLLRSYARELPVVDADTPVSVMPSAFRSGAYPAEYGEEGPESFTIALLTQTASERVLLEAMLKQDARALIRWPGTEFSWVHVVRSHRRRSPVSRKVHNPERWTEIAYLRVDEPPAVQFGDPSASYQALVTSGKTYQQLLDWKAVNGTYYLDVLRGGF